MSTGSTRSTPRRAASSIRADTRGIWSATITDSMKLAKHVLNELGGINDLHRGRVEQAGFAVLKSPDIPSILVETAFISNPSEERRLNDKAYQMKLANAILGGIKRYFAQNPALSKPKIAQVN